MIQVKPEQNLSELTNAAETLILGKCFPLSLTFPTSNLAEHAHAMNT